jgi:hypothetical protein
MADQKVLLALTLVEAVAKQDHTVDPLLTGGFDTVEDAAHSHAYLCGYLIALLAHERRESVSATAEYVRLLMERPGSGPTTGT